MEPMVDFDVARSSLGRRRKLVDELRQRKGPQSQMVSGYYVAPSPLESLSSALGTGLNEYEDLRLNQEEAQLGKQENAAFQKWTSALPRARQVRQTVQMDPMVPNDDEGNPMPGVDQTIDFMEQPTRNDKLGWLAQGMAIPKARQAASKGFSELLDQQPKAIGESMYVDVEGAVQQNPAWKEVQLERVRARQDEITQRLTDRRLDRESQAVLRREQMENQRTLARLAAEARLDAARITGQFGLDRAGVTAGNRGAPSEKLRRQFADTEADIDQLSTAIQQIAAAPDRGTGYIPGAISEMVPGGTSLVNEYWRSPETADAIQTLTYITDGIRHGRFGSALTAVEKASAMQYLPGPYDSKAELDRKARGILGILSRRHELLQQEMAVGGTAPPGSVGSAAPGTTAPARGMPARTVPPGVGQGSTLPPAPGAPTAPYTVTDTDTYNAVPSGARYSAPDGTIRIKP